MRYEEQKFRGSPNNSENLLKAGPLMQMPTEQGLREISATTLKTPGLSFVKRQQPAQAELALFNGQQPHKVDKSHLAEKQQLHLAKPFKLWNPLTW
ncbi:hypothetical protein ACF3NA_08030 [Alkanindiges sp. WGS2144]|uniref:hypothetical protein n=1 Tax=Alkanindiges sp. WGS2144 TaxID=3366808 RepID=UPI0037536561